jgi:hypothetical protein
MGMEGSGHITLAFVTCYSGKPGKACQKTQCPGHDLKRVPAQYKAETFPIEPTCLVQENMRIHSAVS